jgi:hypothetical protein
MAFAICVDMYFIEKSKYMRRFAMAVGYAADGTAQVGGVWRQGCP